MKLFKKAACLLLAAALSVCSLGTAYADSLLLPDSSQTGSEAPAQNPDTGQPAPPEEDPVTPENFDLPDDAFKQPDLSGYTLWDGTTELLAGTNYYINESAKIGKDKLYTLPENSSLLVCGGAELLIYLGGALQIKGAMTVAPGASFKCSGTFSTLKDSSFDAYGTVSFTKSSVVNLSSEFVAHIEATVNFHGTLNLYKDGRYFNYGSTSISKDCQANVTGKIKSFWDGKMIVVGKVSVTLSGDITVEGYLSLSGELLVSGKLTYEDGMTYYKSKTSRLAVTKSGRFVDNRDPFRRNDGVNPASKFEKGVKGIDVSVWQDVIDWQAVKDAGVEFAIIRSSFSGNKQDRLFEYNITEASRVGIPVGVYHYCYALTPEEAREEAQFFLKTIEPYRIDYPVMFDFEDDSQVKLGKEALTEIALAFLEEIKNAGYYPMIYSYRIWLEKYVDMDRLSEYDVAVAEWNVTAPKYQGRYGIWQYSSEGKISGIEGNVDLDICYKDYAKIIRQGGYNRLNEK